MADGPLYTLVCEARDGTVVPLRYAPHTSELTDTAGVPLLADGAPADFDAVLAVSRDTPGRKSAEVATLKIQLGMRCNYGCSYCNQSSAIADATVTRTADAEAFLATLPQWLQGAPERIEFWGGEPLLYFAKLQRLVPALRARFPQAGLSLITNGSLLDADILAFIERWDLAIAVSHDGPGQHLRGPDPFDDPVRAHWLRMLWDRRGRGGRGRMRFNVVLTPANGDIAATRAWLARQVDDPEVALDTEGAVSVYDDRTLHGAGHWPEAAFATLHESIAAGFESGVALQYRSIRDKARDFIASLQAQRPARAVGQKCGMDDAGQLAVDLQGHVMTCQNTGAQGRHRIGHVAALAQARLDTATHWSHREACTHCPVVQLCRGGCMYLDGEHFAQTCENEYRFNLAVLDGILRHVAGLRLLRVEGEQRRPAARRRIPIAAAR